MSLHPDDRDALGLADGDLVEIASRHGTIVGVTATDENLRPGTVSMCHGFGKMPGEPSEPREDGANVNLLTSWDDDFDPHHGQPRMSALPVSISKLATDRTTR